MTISDGAVDLSDLDATIVEGTTIDSTTDGDDLVDESAVEDYVESVAVLSPATACTVDGEVLKWDNTNSLWICGTDDGGVADDLGSHIAIENIQLDGNSLVNDDSNLLYEGINIDDDGKVGINTAPDTNFGLKVIGAVYASGAYSTSDRRWKKNIESLESPLDKVLALKGVSYDWKDPNMGAHQIGLIAQEVEAIYPEFVSTDSNGYKSVNYASMVSPLIESIKELDAKNRSLEARLGRLEVLLAQ